MQEWIKALEEVARTVWENEQRPLLLAQIPAVLRGRGIEPSLALAGRKLRDALREDAAGFLRLIQNPNAPLAWAVVPEGVQLPSDLASIFGDKSGNEHEAVRFKRSVWTAFIKNLADGHRRFIQLSGGYQFGDVSPDEMPPPQGLEIGREYISDYDPAATPDPLQVQHSIEQWAHKNGIPIDSLKHTDSTRGQGPKPRSRKIRYLDVSELTGEDLMRISIPLDLLAKIKFGD